MRNMHIQALKVKFSLNKDLKEILLLTYPAKIMIYLASRLPKEEATDLMMVRKELLE